MIPRVYVAGPYAVPDPLKNTLRAIDVGAKIVSLGGDPFIPHLSYYRNLWHPMPEAYWVAEDLRWLEVCDVLYRIPGESAGADNEMKCAAKEKIPVFTSMAELAAYIDECDDRAY